ncbi:MAG: RluA family pseudouridine synthase, partial [Treponema sp.]|nr:RluA family pseudouridine synthase [Treponema sp.]
MPNLSHTVKEQLNPPLRLDRYVSEILRVFPARSRIKTRKLTAKVNSKNVKLSHPVKQGDCLELCWEDAVPEGLIPQDIPLVIVYEDENCAVIDKAQGMVVHPGAGNRQGTLANALCFRRREKTGINYDDIKKSDKTNENLRAGIVHRLDKDTSGLIIASYNDDAHFFLCEQFRSRSVKKYYIAIVHGVPDTEKGKIDISIARDQNDRKRFTVSVNGGSRGRNAVTFYKVIKSWKNYSLVLLRPRTGRTHQLRVHMRHIGHPILGDPVYGKKDSV